MQAQALANQLETVKWLVEKGHFPVDVRAGGSRITPLMAVVTRKCGSPTDASAGPVKHSADCGIQNKREEDDTEDVDQPECIPMWPMTEVSPCLSLE